ncbi:hypothetical protein RvY_02978 [Ramazzottius varieornatus]|uniref:Uncharacterized protein n=1 Tax=Ramazzottius varieornatus TaxID=947166 RepID=A0A1D1UTK4_RAMVA|nr:hypothetical protein RvY_02978 [Ramazzottius varieornatus]
MDVTLGTMFTQAASFLLTSPLERHSESTCPSVETAMFVPGDESGDGVVWRRDIGDGEDRNVIRNGLRHGAGQDSGNGVAREEEPVDASVHWHTRGNGGEHEEVYLQQRERSSGDEQ